MQTLTGLFTLKRVHLKTWIKGEPVNEKERGNQCDMNPRRMNLKQRRREKDG